jgi:tetratricopeptide (TPR) repeat protein
VKNIAASKNSPRPLAKYDRPITAIICVLLAAIVWLAFSGAVHCEFVNYDDGDYVYENPKIAAGLSLQGIGWAFTHFHAANWHPLTTISHMLDVQLHGLNPSGHHLTNVVLHAAAAILLFLALLRLTSAADSQHSTLNSQLQTAVIDRRYTFWSSAFIAALFAVHPLRVESVAWVSERKDVLSGVFFMLTLWAYAIYAKSKHNKLRHYISVVACFALGLMCKPTLVTLPFILLLLDYWPLGRMQGAGSREQGAKSEARSGKGEGRRDKRPRVVSTSQRCQSGSDLNTSTSVKWSVVRSLVVEKIPLLLLSATSSAITVAAQRQALEPNLDVGLLQRISNAAVSYVLYLWQLIYPVHLTVSYPYLPIKPAAAIAAILFLAVVTAIFVIARKQYPFLIVGWLWYLGALVPMIGLVQVGLQPRADRYTYLPQIGLYLLIVCGAAALAKGSILRARVLFVTAMGVTIALVVLTRIQTAFWRDSETLWRHAVETTPTNYIAYNDLGTLLLHRHEPEAAVVQLLKAIQIKPDFENAYVSAGSAFMLMNRIDEAINYYLKALQQHPDSAEDWSNLATALLKQDKIDEAIADYRKAAALKPRSAEMQYNLGHALANNKQWDDAITCYQAAIGLAPGEAKFHNNLAVAFIQTQRNEQALEELNQALKANPNYPEAHYNLGRLLARLGRRQEAIEHLKQVLRLNPDYADTKQQLIDLGEPPPN